MNKIFQLLLLVIVILQPVSLSAALSLEALEMVEQLRRNLNGQSAPETSGKAVIENVVAIEPGQEQYVVGQELREALKRLRRSVYGSETPVRKVPAALPTVEERAETLAKSLDEEDVSELYIAGVELKEAIVRVRATRDPSEICDEVDKRVVESGEKVVPVEVDETRDENVVASVDEPQEPQEPVEASVPAVTPSEPEPELESDSDSLKLKFKKLVTRQKAAAAQVEEEKTDTSEDLHKLQDKVINREIKKYEFKMPGNYRIIVR